MYINQDSIKKPFFSLLLMAVFWCVSVAQAKQVNVEVQGLMNERAIVSVDNEQYFFRVGETIKGITLIQANNRGALLRVNGKERFYQLHSPTLDFEYSDDFIQRNDALSYEQEKILNKDIVVQAKSHIVSIKPMYEMEHTVTFEVEYFYKGEFGKMARIRADAFFNGKPLSGLAHGYQQARVGRNTVRLNMFMDNTAPEKITTDMVRFELQGMEKVNGSYMVNRKMYPYTKVWKRSQKVRAPLAP